LATKSNSSNGLINGGMIGGVRRQCLLGRRRADDDDLLSTFAGLDGATVVITAVFDGTNDGFNA
jgi:hypothetical protein